MSISTEHLEDLFASCKITADTRRSSAKKTKRDQERLNCATCIKQFNDFGKLLLHLRERGHIHDRQELKNDLKEAGKELVEARASGNERDIATAEFNKKLALLRITALEQLSRRS